jgi:hypothetical protein
MATDRSVRPVRPPLYRGFESEPADEWREDYGQGGPVRSDEPERDWFFENSAAPPHAEERAPPERQGGARASFGDRLRSNERKAVSYRGCGPKGYRPSDERILEIACERLTEHPRVDASDLTVTVDKGVVTINGEVSSRTMRTMVDEVLSAIYGVVRVQNDARVSARIRPQ